MFSIYSIIRKDNESQRTQSSMNKLFANFAFWYEKINNELVQTPNELTLSEFVSVRFSSLFFSGSFMNQGFIADFAPKKSAFICVYLRLNKLIFRQPVPHN